MYKNRHGEYPDALDKLKPEFLEKIPLNPLTGKEFKYKLEKNGFLIEKSNVR